MKRKFGFSALAVMFLALLMTACGGGGDGGSNSPPVLSPPATVSAIPGPGEVTINWTDVTGATSYNVYYDNTSPVTKTTGTKMNVLDNSAVVAALDNGVTYYFVVTAVDANGESVESVEVSATPLPPVLPSAPMGVTAVPMDNAARISWTSVAGATQYNVYNDNTSPVTKATGTKLSGTDNTLDITGLTNGTPYYFVVTAVVNGLESPESNEVTATPASAIPPAPGAPTNVNAAPGAGSATITWSPVATATSYNVYYSESDNVTIATGTKVTGATSGSSIPNLVRGVPYYFVITAVNAGGESAVSIEDSATPLAPNPSFSQADLTGTWNVRVLRSGASSGWYSQIYTVDINGNVAAQLTGGSLTPPSVGPLTFSAGAVRDDANTTFHGQISSGKTLIVGTSTYQVTSFELHIFVKQVPGVTYSSADLASKRFKYQRIYSGSSHIWEIGTGLTDASGLLTFSSQVDKNGPINPVSPASMLSVNPSTGSVTIQNDTFNGVMSPDKKIIVGTSTDDIGPPAKYSLRVIQVQVMEPRYTGEDLVGDYELYSYHSDSVSSWAHATWSATLSGPFTVSGTVSGVNSDGNPVGPFTQEQTIDAQGNIAPNGMLSYGKDLVVTVDTYLDGSSMTVKVQ